MAISDISLTSGMRSNLINLQSTATLLDRTQTRLSTGKKVNSALDDPVNFFKAQSYSNRANDFAGLKDAMSDAIQTVKTADKGITAITTLLNSAKSIATAARTVGTTAEADAYEVQFETVMDQIVAIAEDSSYGGTNLLRGDTLTVTFNPEYTNELAIAGMSVTQGAAAGTASFVFSGVTTTTADPDFDPFSATNNIDATLSVLNGAQTLLRGFSAQSSSNLSIVTARQSFTSDMISNLQTGADNLTLADMNEEGANMLMLQTRQSLGVTALSLSSQAAQSVLRLFG
jgi:flagellin